MAINIQARKNGLEGIKVAKVQDEDIFDRKERKKQVMMLLKQMSSRVKSNRQIQHMKKPVSFSSLSIEQECFRFGI